MEAVTTKIILALHNNLDGKSKQYKDPALTQLFLMNNIHYIVRSVRRFVLFSCVIGKTTVRCTRIDHFLFFRSEAKDVLGDDWVQIHRRIVQQYANQYKRVSWAKVLPLTIHILASEFLLLILMRCKAFMRIYSLLDFVET